MSGIKYYALRDDEELPEEYVVIRHVDGEPKFIASYINTSYLSYENGVLLKMHERNDELRAENAKLMGELVDAPKCEACEAMLDCDECLRADSSQKERRRLEAENAELRKLVYDLLNAWDDMQHEVVTGPTLDDCERHAYELGIEVVP